MAAPDPLKVPPQRTPLSDAGEDHPDSASADTRRAGSFGGGLKGRIFSKVWWKFLQSVVDWVAYIQSEIDNLGPGATASYIDDLGVLSGGTTNITSAVTPNEGDLLTVFWQQPPAGAEQITWDTIFKLVTVDDNDVTPNVNNSVSFKGKTDNNWYMVGSLLGRI